MTYNERYEILNDPDYIGKIHIALCDWLNYWAINGTDSIEDLDLRETTDLFIKFCLSNLEVYASKVATLAISESAIKDAVEVTDANVNIAVTHLLATSLKYLL